MKSIQVKCSLSVSARDGYDSQTIMERDISATVPPGQDPVEFLIALVQEEANKTGRAFNNFPQYRGLTIIEDQRDDERL